MNDPRFSASASAAGRRHQQRPGYRRPPTSADGILDAAGGCPTLRRTVFHYLDRYEALRLADASPAWRDAASESVAWLPGLLQYLRSQSTRSVTVANDTQDQQSATPPSSSSQLHHLQARGGLRRSISPGSGGARSRSPLGSNSSQQSSGRRSPLLAPTSSGATKKPVSPIQQPLPQQQQQRGNNNNSKGQVRRRGADDDDDDANGSGGRVHQGSNSSAGGSTTHHKSQPLSPISASAATAPAAYVPPNFTTEAGHGLFTPFARQHIARSAFGPTHVYSGNPIPGDVLANLWNLTSPELYFLVSQAFRRPPREMALILEHCDKLVGLVLAGQASAVQVQNLMTNVQSQIFLALSLLCHPSFEKRTERRFLLQFPCTLILLRCANVLRCSSFEWKAPSSLTSTLLAPSYFKNQSYRGTPATAASSSFAASFVNGKNLSPVVLLLGEMMRWHDAEPMREHAPWFAALATWAPTALSIWSDLPFHPIFTLPHVLTLKSLALAPAPNHHSMSRHGTSGAAAAASAVSASSRHHHQADAIAAAGGGGGGGGSLADAIYDGNYQQQEEEMKELQVVRMMLRRHIDAEATVKAVVRSAVDMAMFFYRKQRGFIPTILSNADTGSNNKPSCASSSVAPPPSSSPSSSQPVGSSSQSPERKKMLLSENSRRVALSFHALAKLEELMRAVVWDAPSPEAEAALQAKYERLIESEVQLTWGIQLGNSQVGINLLYEARGKLAEAQAMKYKT